MIQPNDPIHGNLKSVEVASHYGVPQYVAVFEDGTMHELNLGNGLGSYENLGLETQPENLHKPPLQNP